MSRVWIYQAERKLTDDEVEKVKAFLGPFVAEWKAHGAKLAARFDVLHQLFVVLQVDETNQPATGCSIDESVHAMKELEKRLGIGFFNRQRVAYIADGKVENCSMIEFKKLAQSGAVDGQTQVFNNTLSTVEEFEGGWLTTAGESWHKMMLS